MNLNLLRSIGLSSIKPELLCSLQGDAWAQSVNGQRLMIRLANTSKYRANKDR
jgi:hypothetical protein